MKEVPAVGKTYALFDDGKIRLSRMLTVHVTEVIPFSKATTKMLTEWEHEVEGNTHLYSNFTDFFIKAINLNGTLRDCDERYTFARTIDGGWFGFGDWLYDGRLDIDGSLRQRAEERQL